MWPPDLHQPVSTNNTLHLCSSQPDGQWKNPLVNETYNLYRTVSYSLYSQYSAWSGHPSVIPLSTLHMQWINLNDRYFIIGRNTIFSALNSETIILCCADNLSQQARGHCDNWSNKMEYKKRPKKRSTKTHTHHFGFQF